MCLEAQGAASSTLQIGVEAVQLPRCCPNLPRCLETGAHGGIRTHDLLLRRQLLALAMLTMPPMLTIAPRLKQVRNQVINRRALTDQAIRALHPPDKGYRIEWDALAGFGCRISQAGTRAFVVLVASGRPKTIGRYPLMSLADARREARRLLAEKTLGRTHPTHTAFEDVRESYLAHCANCVRAGTMRPSTFKNYKLLLENYLPFARKSLADITPRQITHELNKLTPSMKEHAFRAARTFFKHCVREHLIDRSPFENMASAPLGRPRTRVLAEDELCERRHALAYCTGLQRTSVRSRDARGSLDI